MPVVHDTLLMPVIHCTLLLSVFLLEFSKRGDRPPTTPMARCSLGLLLPAADVAIDHQTGIDEASEEQNEGHGQKGDDVKDEKLVHRQVLAGRAHIRAPVLHDVVEPSRRHVDRQVELLAEQSGGGGDSLLVARLARHLQHRRPHLASRARAQIQHFRQTLDAHALCVVGLVVEERRGDDGHGVVQSLVLTVLVAVADEHLGVGVTQQVVLGQPPRRHDLGWVG